jgi:hypothetical protein
VFSCPPYADLERYSNDPADLSNMPYDAFLVAYQQVIDMAVAYLRPNRFAAWVVGEVRTKKRPDRPQYGFVADTVKAFQQAGCHLYNDHIVLTPIGTAAMRAPTLFNASRKASRVHEYLLVFVKGDGQAATKAVGGRIDEYGEYATVPE